ncbi:MAG: OmpA family protein [Bacteroidetes bacterium]|nr:OmpA family protein [Bacteroidota bacterium]
MPVLRKHCALILIFLCSIAGAEAQGLLGKITDNDSAATVLFQAEITQYQDGKAIGTYKTYYDGSYRIKVKPNQTYELKVTYPGRSDTTVTITTDKFGTLAIGSLNISLRKNGLRLMGYILDQEDDIPIKDAGIIIRNVMTRKEDKYFTDVNGYYNLKMDFETNYTFKIDKRSPGIINKFQDTSFNISTIGFNQPLDFRLDIRLGPARDFVKERPEYDPYARPDNKNLKPVVQVMGKKDSARLRQQTAAIAELDRKLGSKDSAIASIDQKLKTISTTKQDEKQALNTESEQKQKEAAERQRAENERKVQAELKKREAEKAEADLKVQQDAAAEAKKNEGAAAAARHKEEQRAAAELKAKQAAEAAEAVKQAKAKKEQEEEIEKARLAKLREEVEKEELIRIEQERKEKEAAAQVHQQETPAATVSPDQQRIDREALALARADSALAADEARRIQSGKPRIVANKEEKKPEIKSALTREEKEAEAIARADSAIAAAKAKKAKVEEPAVAKADVTPDKTKQSAQKDQGKISYTVVPSDSAMTEAERREQKEQDLAKMKKARAEAEAKMLAERRDKEAQEKAAKRESKRLARELAEKEKMRKRQMEDDLKRAEDVARLNAKKNEAERQQRELEARRAQEEAERMKLISERDKLINDQQVSVVKNTEAKDSRPGASHSVPASDQALLDSSHVVVLNTSTHAVGRAVTTHGLVRNGQTEEPVAGVSINIRRLNGLVSQEVTSDSAGSYTFAVDSGYFYLVSYFREGYEISKQILDLTSYKKPQYTMLIQYLKEHDEFDPAARMPFVQFEKNSSRVPSDLWGELEPIVKMMQDIPQLKMKIYGMASADEDYPMELSVTRARMVADMMMEAGIKPLRLRINGLGDLRPRSGCTEGKECTQDQYRQDRAVLYKVVKE